MNTWLNYWCLSHIRNKLLLRISWGMRTCGWNMNVCLELLLVILKYSQRCFRSAVAVVSCAPVTWGWALQRWTELAVTISRQHREVREHCYLDFFGVGGWKWKMRMMQVSEIRVTALPFVWCVWHLRAAADEPSMGSGKHSSVTSVTIEIMSCWVKAR